MSEVAALESNFTSTSMELRYASKELVALKLSACVRTAECRWRNWSWQPIFGIVILALIVAPSFARAFEIRQAGKLRVSPRAQLFAFSTDAIIQEVLSQDFRAASRASSAGAASTVTVSVNVTQQVLRPGVSLAQIAPGDPQVADLMKAAGANPPPLDDTGNEYDQAALARRLAAQDYMPEDTLSDRLINSGSSPGPYFLGMGPPIPIPCGAQMVAQPGCPPVPQSTASTAATPSRSVGDVQQYLERRNRNNGWLGVTDADANDYDTIVVARASATGSPEEMTLIAVSHPGEDISEVKKNIAERIASSILN
jgi:hypothetical protein